MNSGKNLISEQEAQKTQGADTSENPVSLRKPKMKDKPANDSVDDQIDALLLRYETSSIRKEPSLKESLSKLNLRLVEFSNCKELGGLPNGVSAR